MSESATQNESISLYHYLCQNIVGSEEDVQTIRMLNNVRDNIQSNKLLATITSGSFGEGLEMRGSDLDIMFVIKFIEVCEDTHIDFNADKIYFTMELEDTQPGFTKLRLVHSGNTDISEYCDEIDSDFYFSNLSFKHLFSNDNYSTVHGPCVSDENGRFDLAYCLHSKVWITQAQQWVIRSNNSWPSYDVKHAIVNHGVLFVPVGLKGSAKEELEWRISSSVGEKLLIHTFTHTQLLCYTLMKILLKDVITLDKDCKELLCSYFMKTILFWICEELPSSIWKPANLISCFMRCFRRLIYCVEYKVCPHYFIPENNLFENKIKGHAQELLLKSLYILNSYGWQCILLSDQISNSEALEFRIYRESSYLHADSVKKLLFSLVMIAADSLLETINFRLENGIYMILSSKSSKVKYMLTYYISKYICETNRLLTFEEMSCNKSTYRLYKTYTRALLLSTRHDVVSGWLVLASFFYNRQQYNSALYIVQYTLLNCSPEKLNRLIKCSDIHYELFNLKLFKKMNIVQLWRFFLLDMVTFNENAISQPEELQKIANFMIPPVVYAHFLCFLCHYHLKNSRQCWDSLRNLHFTIEDNYFIANRAMKSCSYNILSISYQLLGDKESRRQALLQSWKIFPEGSNRALQMLSLIN